MKTSIKPKMSIKVKPLYKFSNPVGSSETDPTTTTVYTTISHLGLKK